MKKSIFITLFLLAGVIIFSRPTEANAEEYFITIHNNVPVYDNRTGTFKPVANIAKGQTFKIDSDYSKSHYRIKIGNEYGYINKRSTKLEVGMTNIKNISTKANSTNTVITNVNTLVYEKKGKSFTVFASISKNRRYPIVSEEGSWYLVNFGERIGYIKKSDVSKDNGIPVLMYHHILKEEENVKFVGVSTTINLNAFNEQMDFLKKNGYETISMEDFKKYATGKLNLPGKTVLITFDDGIKSSFIYAFPKLKQHGFKATQFIITGRTRPIQIFDPNRLQFLSNEEMQEMSSVFSYSNHTDNMHNLINSTGYVLLKPYLEVKTDIQRAQSILNNGTSEFAYPFGQYNASTIQILKELKFSAAFTTKSGKVKIGDNMLELKRVGIGPNDTINTFIKKVEN